MPSTISTRTNTQNHKLTMIKGTAAILTKTVAIALLIGGVLVSLKLIDMGTVSQWTFCFLVASSVAVFAVVWLGPALELIKVSNIIELRSREVKASADVVKRLSLLIADYAKASLDGAYVGLTKEADAEVRRCIDEIKKIAA